MSNLIDDELI